VPIGLKIKEFCDKNFSSVVDFSTATGINRNTIYQYFKEEVLPGTPFLKKLRELGCDLNWLFDDETAPGAMQVSEPMQSYMSEVELLKRENKELKSQLEGIKKFLK
jgi:transcriptional regulator with XRE-family HTH domain